MASALCDHLLSLLEASSAPLHGVTRKCMFGCDALFAEGSIYALVWKTGRIGLRLPDAALHEELMSMSGAGPWCAGTKSMSHWVLVPEDFHDDEERLTLWVRRAHALAATAADGKGKVKPAPGARPSARRPARKSGPPRRNRAN